MGFIFIFVSLMASADVQPGCQLKQKTMVHLVGNIHGTPVSQETEAALIPAAFKNKIVLGLEMDEKTLNSTLDPLFKYSLVPMEEPISKGFGVALWAWRVVTWLKIKNELQFIHQIYSPDIDNAVGSFSYFVGTNSSLQEAYLTAKANALDVLAKDNPDLQKIVERVDELVKTPISLSETEVLLPIQNIGSLATLSVFFKEVLRAYTQKIISSPETVAALSVPNLMNYLIPLLDFKPFNKNDKDYGFQIYSYDRQYRSIEAAVLFDWRSLQMAQNIIAQLCERQKLNLPALPYVAFAGAGHLSYMEKVLESSSVGTIETTLSVPPSSHSDFQNLLGSF